MKLFFKDCSLVVVILTILFFTFITSGEYQIAILFMVWLSYLIRQRKWVIYRIQGMKYLLIYMILGIAGGLIYSNPPYYLIRDLYYTLFAIIAIYLGYILYKFNHNISIVKTYVVCAVSISFIQIVRILVNYTALISLDINKWRASIGDTKYIIAIAIALLIMKKFYGQEYIVGRKLDSWLLVILFIPFILSFSRTFFLTLFISILVFFILSPKKNRKSKIAVKRAMYGIFIFFSAIILMYNILPHSLVTNFMDKFMNSFQELNTKLDWENSIIVTQNWRGYERYSANKLFDNAGVFNKLFGFGFGKLIPLKYSDLVGVPISDGGITVLHSGYHTVLIKGGITGLLCYILFLLTNIKISLKKIKDNKHDFIHLEENVVILSFCIAMIFMTNVVTGIFIPTSFTIDMIIFGMVLAKNNHINKINNE